MLEAHEVDYLLVGGVAATVYGALRATHDLDCVAQRDRDNLDRLASALRQLHARLRVGGLDDDEAARLPVVLDGTMLAQVGISTWRTDAGDLDVLADIPDRDGGRLGFRRLKERASTAVIGNIVVRVAGLDDIIASKQRADRPKDREALPELLRLRANQGAVQPDPEPNSPLPAPTSTESPGVDDV